MPMYEYQCQKCGERFEAIQKFSDAPLETHEACGGHVERLISAPALQFKGSGWYITDYARSGNSPAGKGGKNGGGSSESKSETKSETKTESTATKSDSK
ncbi:MAG: zinc ribbon domain-containing protein [Bryobacterales bacterium]|nr:zinc ribbon domain-containing protein [Bryobacterales bacterium]